MQRFNSWEQSVTPDFWRERFRPKDLMRVTAHADSVLSLPMDAKLLERYDINEIDEHTPGSTVTWVKLTLDEPRYLEPKEDYPWEYDIDSNWLYIDAIYDKFVDPSYRAQHDIDFALDEASGKLRFVHKVPEGINLYISKGQYAEYRIYNEIGMLLDYKRKDSLQYRDSIAPILKAFYLGPTPENLLAVLAVAMGHPVAKYGKETVLSIKGKVVTTDKYFYVMDEAIIGVKEGDVLYKHQPLSNVVELLTHKTHPYWWLDKPVDLFMKYKVDDPKWMANDPDKYPDYQKHDGPMTRELRDYLMRTFLYDAVAYIRINNSSKSTAQLLENSDIMHLFYEALPTRTDIFLTQAYSEWTWDDDTWIMPPNKDYIGLRIPMYSQLVKNKRSSESDMFILASRLGRPVITDTVQSTPIVGGDKPLVSLTLDDGKWHIFDTNDHELNEYEFWRSKWSEKPFVEPYHEELYLRLSTTPPWQHKEFNFSDIAIPDTMTTLETKINFHGDGTSGMYSEIQEQMSDISFGRALIEGSRVYNVNEFKTFTINGLVVINSQGLQVGNGDYGYAISTPIDVGRIPKNVAYRTQALPLPLGGSYKVSYSQDGNTWTYVDPDTLIRDISGVIYFRIEMEASKQESPTLQSLFVNITTNNVAEQGAD